MKENVTEEIRPNCQNKNDWWTKVINSSLGEEINKDTNCELPNGQSNEERKTNKHQIKKAEQNAFISDFHSVYYS